MPNHVTTTCTVTGPIADVPAFVERHIVPLLCTDHDDCKQSPKLAAACRNALDFDFNTIIPQPKVLEGTISPDRDHPQNRLAEKETGYSNWYDWAIANWGTKWGAYDFEERSRGDGRYVFKFETAWSFPEKVFRKLAEMHPTLTIAVASYDEGGNFGAIGEFNGRNDFRAATCATADSGTVLATLTLPSDWLDWVHDVGSCFFCELSGTDVHAWHEEHCPLRNIDPENPPPKKKRTAEQRSTSREGG